MTNSNDVRCSVIMPNHNCLAYLKQAVASVQAQEIKDWELIIADDDSTDGSRQWIRQQSQQDPRIQLLPVRVHHPAAARNAAMQIARSKWLAFLDADDTWSPSKLTQQLAFHQQNPDIIMSFTDYRHIDEANQDKGTCFEFWQRHELLANDAGFQRLANPFETLFGCNCVGTSTVMVAADAIWRIGGFDVSLPSAEDWDLWLKLASLGAIGVSHQCQTQYLMRQGSESSKLASRIQALEMIYARHEAKIKQSHMAVKRQAQAHVANAKSELAQASNQLGTALASKLKSLMLQPTSRQAKEFLSMLKPS